MRGVGRDGPAIRGLLGRAAVWLVAPVVISIVVAPPPGWDDRTRSEPDDPARPADAVTLRVPKGAPAGHLTVVDESGRELATLTHLTNGDTAIVARRRDGVSVGCYLNARGAAILEVIGRAGRAGVEARPDGTTTISAIDVARPLPTDPGREVPGRTAAPTAPGGGERRR